VLWKMFCRLETEAAFLVTPNLSSFLHLPIYSLIDTSNRSSMTATPANAPM
jgi:hypothetical protein